MSSRGPSRASIANGRLFSGARGKALAIEDALHHELYTALAPNRFKEFWREWVQSVPATPATRAWALGQQLARRRVCVLVKDVLFDRLQFGDLAPQLVLPG